MPCCVHQVPSLAPPDTLSLNSVLVPGALGDFRAQRRCLPMGYRRFDFLQLESVL